jgi:hypothetical protein
VTAQVSVHSFQALQLNEDKQSSFSSMHASDAAPKHHKHSSEETDDSSTCDTDPGGSSIAGRQLLSAHPFLRCGCGTSVHAETKKTAVVIATAILKVNMRLFYVLSC